MDPIISTASDRCRRCYSCVRRCPAKAIRVTEGQAHVITERCVACGRCITVCTRQAKVVTDNLPAARDFLATGQAVAMLAPAFPAAFTSWRPGQLIAALRRLGFAGIYEVAFGAELVSQAYRRRYERDPDQPTLTTPCPAAVNFIRKFAPQLVPFLAPILSPMAAMGRALKERVRPGCTTLFLGPCTAKILEGRDPEVAPWVDGVITFAEVRKLLEAAGINPLELEDEEFDPPRAGTGAIYPVPGGLARVAELPIDLLENRVHTTVGVDGFMDAVERLKRRLQDSAMDELETRFFDVLFCRGCVSGPVMGDEESELRRKERLVEFFRSRPGRATPEELAASLAALADLDLSRHFDADDQTLGSPSEAQIREILAWTNKLAPEDELNCKACGYASCRDKAIAVYKGFAEVDMCLPFLIERLEATVTNLNRSHEQLTEAQEQLLRSERLASMGQLAAGIAHEVNNPLGTILIYAHLLADAGELPDEVREDAEMIRKEALRCKNIVGGLLDFARQNKVRRVEVNLRALLEECVRIIQAQMRQEFIAFFVMADPDLPPAFIDRDQLQQVLINLARNAVEAMPGGGAITLSAEWLEEHHEFRIQVSDTGAGIKPEHLDKLFTPFFSTKPVGRGTGLGLPICYGIVKMHRGQITARNNKGAPGATFEIRIPGEQAEALDTRC